MIRYEDIEYITALSLKKYQNYEIHDLSTEQWRQFEILWAREQVDKTVKDFQNDLFSEISEQSPELNIIEVYTKVYPRILF